MTSDRPRPAVDAPAIDRTEFGQLAEALDLLHALTRVMGGPGDQTAPCSSTFEIRGCGALRLLSCLPPPRHLPIRYVFAIIARPGGATHTINNTRQMSSTHTGIEWTEAVWNPMTGCTQISAGCDHCYAKAVAQRRTRALYLAGNPVRDTVTNRADPFAPRFWEERLDQPLRWKRPMRVFVNSMSDVFHAHFTVEMIARVFAVMNRAQWHQFQVLTKRPERAARLAHRFRWTPNIWIGTSIEDMRVAARADHLRRIRQAHVRFISAEPLLGCLDELDLTGIDWVIGGGESGSGYRPVHPDWARGLRDRCEAFGVPFFWKQWGGSTPKAGGRVLDGRLWEQYPVLLGGGARRAADS